MELINALGNYFLSVWLWSISWGMYHVPFAILYMFLITRFFLRMGWVSSIGIAVGSNIFAWVVYTCAVLGVFGLVVSFEYIPTMPHAQICERMALIAFSLGLIYTVIQVVLFACVSLPSKLNFPRAVLMAFIVNMLAALTVYAMLPLYC